MIITKLYNIKNLNTLKNESNKVHSLNPLLSPYDFLFKVEENYQLRKDLLPEIKNQIESIMLLNETILDINKIKVNKVYYQGIGNIEFI